MTTTTKDCSANQAGGKLKASRPHFSCPLISPFLEHTHTHRVPFPKDPHLKNHDSYVCVNLVKHDQNQHTNQGCQVYDVQCKHVFESQKTSKSNLFGLKRSFKRKIKCLDKTRPFSERYSQTLCVRRPTTIVPAKSLPLINVLKASFSLFSLPQMRLSKERERKCWQAGVDKNDIPTITNRERDREIFLKLSANENDSSQSRKNRTNHREERKKNCQRRRSRYFTTQLQH